MTNIVHIRARKELCAEYDRKLNLWVARAEQLQSERIAKRKSFWRASIEIAVLCLVAAFVGVILAVGHS